MAQRRDMGSHEPSVARAITPADGTRSHAQCRDHGQPVGENDGKRGHRGFDRHKRVKGRKRHLLVDTQGLVVNVVISEASMSERDLAQWLLQSVQSHLPRLKLIWADAAYRGERFLDEFQLHTGVKLEVVKRSPEQRYFQVEPKRWVVERTFAWLGHARRLAKDYELSFKSSAAMVYAAMIRIQLRRLALAPP